MASLGKNHVEKIANEWSRYGLPIRPGVETLNLITREIDGTECNRILILGATPELVDFFLRKKAGRITLIDWSEVTVKAMESLGLEDWTGVEKITADWRTRQEHLGKSFDIISGDCPFNMVSFPEDWETVLRHLSAYLIPGGLIIVRNMFYPTIPFSFPVFLKDALRHLRKMNRNKDSFKDLVSAIRLGAYIGSVDSRSLILRERELQLEREACEKLKTMVNSQEDLEIIESLLGVEKEGKPQRGATLPRKEDVAEIFHAAGFMVKSFQPAENQFRLEASFLLTAVKA